MFSLPKGKNYEMFQAAQKFLRIFQKAWDMSDYASVSFSILLCMSKDRAVISPSK
jgi:hypothetical protein